MSVAGPARIKGAAFREFLLWYADTRGTPTLRAAAERLPASLRPDLELDREALGVIASSWYPVDEIYPLLDELTRGASVSQRAEMAHEGAKATLGATLRGIYRVLFRAVATPELYARHAQRIWASYYDRGRLEIVMKAPGRAESRIVDWDTHHPFVCELNACAPEILYEAMGCRDVRAERVRCRGEGASECAFVTTWSA